MKMLFKLLLFIAALLPLRLTAQNPIADAIKQNKGKLHYPRSVERFYQQEGFRLVWILKDTVKTPAWATMLLLDCVLQYGLNPTDYHPLVLTYDNLHRTQKENTINSDKAAFDVLMTDAIITVINNLHYGKLNPYFPAEKIDGENITEFRGDKILIDALDQNDIMNAILKVQPHSEAYINLQRHMKLVITKYTGTTRVKPESDIRKMAINMERLRWINTTGKKIHLTCVVKDGVIIYYKDIDKQDQSLENRLLH